MANQFTSGRREHHLQATREKIQAANLIHRLQECVFGKVELSSQQVAAAKTLLAKVLPDLQATQNNGGRRHPLRRPDARGMRECRSMAETVCAEDRTD